VTVMGRMIDNARKPKKPCLRYPIYACGRRTLNSSHAHDAPLNLPRAAIGEHRADSRARPPSPSPRSSLRAAKASCFNAAGERARRGIEVETMSDFWTPYETSRSGRRRGTEQRFYGERVCSILNADADLLAGNYDPALGASGT